MGQVIDLKAKGRYTYPNQIGSVPQGAMIEAKNTVIDKDDVIQTKRGSKPYISAMTAAAKQLLHYKDTVLVHFGSTLGYDSGLGIKSDYAGTYAAPTGRRMRAFRAIQNLYFTTTEGVKRLTSLAGTPTQAGGIKALDGIASTSGSSGFMSDDVQVAYRVVWGIKDVNENLILGAPSERITLTNTAGFTRDVSLTITIPDGITTDYFYQIYRSGESASGSDEPNDELQLVIENHPSSAEITASEVTVLDNVPNALRGASLYTNPSQQGIANANNEPPLCKDLTVYKGHALYANTETKQRLFIDLLAVGTNAFDINDTITIDGVSFTGKATENAGSNEFKIFTAGTPAINIADTAKSLVRVVNKSSANVYAYYISNFEDLPGRMLFEDKTFGGSDWAAVSSNGDFFSPTLPASGTDVQSSNESRANRLYISKPDQPDSVPLLNFLDIGSEDDEILRVIALRDSTFIFKEDGIFRMIGEDITSFRVSLYDNTAILKGIETADTLNNQVFCFTTQGVTSVSDSGVEVISRAIEGELIQGSSDAFTSFESISFGVGYESERKYILYVPTLTSDTYATQAHVYNTFTKAWTRWVEERTCAIINPGDDRLYTGQGDVNNVRQERKSFLVTDYTEDEYAVTISSFADLVVTLASASDAVKGQTLAQIDSDGKVLRQAKISSVSGNDVTVDRSREWDTAAPAAVLYDPIDVEIKWTPITAGNPGVLKQFPEVSMFFEEAQFDSIDILFSSNFTEQSEATSISPVKTGSWGSGTFGGVPWGGGAPRVQPIRTYVPLEQQRAHWLNMSIEHSEAVTLLAISGFSMIVHEMSERFR